MDRDTLLGALKASSVWVVMNNNESHLIPSLEFAIVDDISAYVLTKRGDGRYRTIVLSLACMVSIEPVDSKDVNH